MFIAKSDNLIVGANYSKEELKHQLEISLINYDSIEETKDVYIYFNGVYIKEQELTQKRKKEFESKFLETSLGNYRLEPKGYANAQQSVDTINNIVTAMGSLTKQIADMIIFYETPEFTKEEQCTEEWLVEHQHSPNPMTKEEWTKFYIEFTTLYAQKQYQLALTQN